MGKGWGFNTISPSVAMKLEAVKDKDGLVADGRSI